MIVTEEDLKGELKYFPSEVVQKMVERQVEQGNYANVEVFQSSVDSYTTIGGFDWIDTEEGYDFWQKVLGDKNFELFFEKYPKLTAESVSLTPSEKKGVKYNENKLKMSKLFTQFPEALKAIVLASTYGHIKYEETDSDWLNFKRLDGEGSKDYSDAMFRHFLIGSPESEESGLYPEIHRAWNAIASLQLFLEEQDVNVDELAKEFIPKWRLLKTQNKLTN